MPDTTAILSARGAFYRVAAYESFGPSYYAIEELDGNRVNLNPSGLDKALDNTPSQQPKILINGVQIGKRDITSQVPCLDNVKSFYSFGQNFGDVAIHGEVLLGSVGQPDVAEKGLRTLTEFFETYRVSRRYLPISVSVASHAFYVYMTGIVLHPIDAQFHVLPFTIMGTLLDLAKEQFWKVNPKNRVVALTEDALDDPSLAKALGERKSVFQKTTTSTGSSSGNSSASAPTNNDQVSVVEEEQTVPEEYSNPAAVLSRKKMANAPLTEDESRYDKELRQYQSEIGRVNQQMSSAKGDDLEDLINKKQELLDKRKNEIDPLGDRILRRANQDHSESAGPIVLSPSQIGR